MRAIFGICSLLLFMGIGHPSRAAAAVGAGWQLTAALELRADAGCFDPNGDGATDPADFFYLFEFLYRNGPMPIGNADANADGDVDFADLVYLYNYLYLDGPSPVC